MRGNLKLLDLSSNKLEKLHENLAALNQLEILNLSNNPELVLEKVHYRYLLKNLSVLNLDQTSVGEQGLTDILCFATASLKGLSVRGCKLRELPAQTIWGNATNCIRQLNGSELYFSVLAQLSATQCQLSASRGGG